MYYNDSGILDKHQPHYSDPVKEKNTRPIDPMHHFVLITLSRNTYFFYLIKRIIWW